jgi:hypothetical protein
MKKLHDSYGRKVIVLVDEHDAPVQFMHGDVSFEDSSNNRELMNSIKILGETITDLLGEMAKSNMDLHKLLMIGISNSIISFRHSGFNNLKTYDVLSTYFSKFFAIRREEISNIVEKVFKEIQPEHKEEIMKNVKNYYNGYYFPRGEELYSIFSTIKYLDE